MIPFEDSFSLWQIYSNLGLIAFRANNPFEAIRYFQRCVQYGQQVYLSDSLGIVLMNMGLCHLLRGEIASAERAFQQSSQRLQKMGNYRALAMLHANMAMLRMSQKRYDSAKKYAEQARLLDKRFGHPMTSYTYSLVESFLFADQDQPSLALSRARTAFQIARDRSFDYKRYEVTALLVEMLCRNGSLKDASVLYDELKQAEGLEPAQEFALEAAGAWLAIFYDKKDLAEAYRGRIRVLMEGSIGLRPDVKYQYERIVDRL